MLKTLTTSWNQYEICAEKILQNWLHGTKILMGTVAKIVFVKFIRTPSSIKPMTFRQPKEVVK